MSTPQRHLFDELKQGIKEIGAHKAGKSMLNTRTIIKKPNSNNEKALLKG